MNKELLIGLTTIIFGGLLAQWLSWRFKLPSILLLLVFGFLMGPITGVVNPDKLLGDLLFPIVSVSVGLILFEGGMNLKLSELKSVGGTVRNLVTIGILITWVLSAASAYLFLGTSIQISILFGAILVVTGPTVILPILRFIKPKGQIGSVMKWEGIVNDPIGAVLAILVFEVIIAAGVTEALKVSISGFFATIIFGTLVGGVAAYILILLIKYRFIPEYLQNPITLALVVAAFTGQNLIQAESGLYAVTVMGILLANHKDVDVKHIIEFKENLRVILISFLFIILAARVEPAAFSQLGWGVVYFLAVLIIIIRPLTVFASTIKSKLSGKERVMLSGMAPRGIVAAAVASLFALELERAGVEQAGILVPLTFLVIVATILIYSLAARPLSSLLNLSNPNPQGILILGAHKFSRKMAKTLKAQDIKILLVDSNYENISAAKMEDLPTYYGSIMSEFIIDKLNLDGIGRLLAVTPNREVNSLAALHFMKVFGKDGVYQLCLEKDTENGERELSSELRGHILFSANFDYSLFFDYYYLENSDIKATKITEKFSYEDFLDKHSDHIIIPMFLIKDNGDVNVYSELDQPVPKKNQTIISMVIEEDKI